MSWEKKINTTKTKRGIGRRIEGIIEGDYDDNSDNDSKDKDNEDNDWRWMEMVKE